MKVLRDMYETFVLMFENLALDMRGVIDARTAVEAEQWMLRLRALGVTNEQLPDVLDMAGDMAMVGMTPEDMRVFLRRYMRGELSGLTDE